MATRVNKYGLVPIGCPPQAAIDELFRANSLWNTLVALHRESRENWDDARRSASILYSEKMDELDKKNEDITLAFKGLNQARMDEGTKDETGNKRLKAERAVIDRLKKEKGDISAELKPLRAEADKSIDKKLSMTPTVRSVMMLYQLKFLASIAEQQTKYTLTLELREIKLLKRMPH